MIRFQLLKIIEKFVYYVVFHNTVETIVQGFLRSPKKCIEILADLVSYFCYQSFSFEREVLAAEVRILKIPVT